MTTDHSIFLHEAAAYLRQLAERAPGICRELHRFADDLGQLAVDWVGDEAHTRDCQARAVVGRALRETL